MIFLIELPEFSTICPKYFQDLSFKTAVYNIISHLCYTGVGAVAIGLLYSNKQQP